MLAIIAAVASWAWNALQASVDVIVFALQLGFKALKFGLGAVWDVGKFVWSDVLKPVGIWLDRVYVRFRAFYDRVFGPIQTWLQRVSKVLRHIYDTFWRPILNTIDNVRRLLQLLSLLHIKLAAQLDAELGLLERKISLPIQLAIEWVNRIQNRIESYVLTVDNLFRRATLLKSVARDVGAIANIAWNSSLRNIDRAENGGFDPTDPLAPVEDHVKLFETVVAGEDDAEGVNASAAMEVFEALTAAP